MTPHIEAKKTEIAKTVIMPGDPLRAKYIAENYLENYRLVSKVRNIYAYTGYYKGVRLTVMASGMGMGSMGIYSYELFKFYDVDNIIRVGSCGAYTSKLDLYDLILVENSYSTSSFAKDQSNYEDNNIKSSRVLNEVVKECASNLNLKLNVGTIYSTDVFYNDNPSFDIKKLNEDYNCLGVEMETYALFNNAKNLNKNATCILTVSDNLVTKLETTSNEREKSFTSMMELALESVVRLEKERGD